jgi:hypothetical protein
MQRTKPAIILTFTDMQHSHAQETTWSGDMD